MHVKVKKYEIPVGEKSSSCRAEGCQERIFWLVTESGKKTPVNPDGTSHFATCPGAREFRKQRQRAAGATSSPRIVRTRAGA